MNLTGLKIPTGGRQTSWLFTNMTEELNWGPPRNNSSLVVRAGLEPATSGFQVRRPNHSATLPRCAVVRFCYHSYDYRLNWTPLSPITITYFHCILIIYLILFYVSDFVGLTKKNANFYVMLPLFWLSTIAQESQQSASRGRVFAFYRIAPCLNRVFFTIKLKR